MLSSPAASYYKAAEMSDTSGPLSPSESTSSIGSPSGDGRVEPMGLTDFIGALTREPKDGKSSSKRERKESLAKDPENYGKEKEFQRALDSDFDYRKSIA